MDEELKNFAVGMILGASFGGSTTWAITFLYCSSLIKKKENDA